MLRYLWVIVAVFTIDYFLLSFVENTKNEMIRAERDLLLNQARSHFKDQVNNRRWNAGYAGVFAKAKPGQKPNPYLDNNTLKTDKNEILIKINPAWMTRQLSELIRDEKYFFRITSLKPINPSNTANEFEKEALEYMEQNTKKEFFRVNKELSRFEYMGVLFVEKSCLECHAKQGYEIGDVRGGISVYIDSQKHLKNSNNISLKAKVIQVIIILLSILIIFLAINLLRHNERLEKIVKDRTKKLKKLANTDTLTGISNRGYFIFTAEKQFKEAVVLDTDLHMLSIDIDDFKTINDTYGHQAGDKVLKMVVDGIKDSLREDDIFGRIGGEEFAVVLGGVSQSMAKSIAERVIEDVKKLSINYDGHKISVTLSIGLATLDDHKNLDSLLKDSDIALYEAKNNGKDRLEVFQSHG